MPEASTCCLQFLLALCARAQQEWHRHGLLSLMPEPFIILLNGRELAALSVCKHGYAHRQRGDSKPCGQSPMDFEFVSLTARTHCLVQKEC